MSQDREFVGLQDAANLTGMSYSAIRHIVSKMTEAEKKLHLRRTGKRKGVMISKEYLATKYDFEDDDKLGIEQRERNDKLMDALLAELKDKKETIKSMQQIKKLELMKDLINQGVHPNDLINVLGMSKEERVKVIQIMQRNEDN